MNKKILTSLLTITILCTPMLSLAEGGRVYDEKGMQTVSSISEDMITPKEISYFYKYVESKSSTQRGGAVRVSDTLISGNAGGTIMLTKSFTSTISWGISAGVDIQKAITRGVSFGIEKELKTELGYTLNLPPNRKAHMIAVPVYNISTGTLNTYQGQVLRKSESITIKSPSHFEYSLRFE